MTDPLACGTGNGMVEQEEPPWRSRGDERANELHLPLVLLPPQGKGGLFLEVFAGKAVLTRAVQKRHGRVCLPAIDLFEGLWKLDLPDTPSVSVLSSWIHLRWVHFGTPCSSFSCAVRKSSRREVEYVAIGDEEDKKILGGSETARATAALINECRKISSAWSLENPQTSLMWRFPAIRDAVVDALKVDLDMCQYDGRLPGDLLPYRKTTRVMTNMRAFEGLN